MEWASTIGIGVIGGVSGHLSTVVSSLSGSKLVNSAANVTISGVSAALSDTAVQKANILAGNQEDFDAKRMVRAAATSALTAVGMESIKGGIYATTGGPSQLANDEANHKMILNKVKGEEDQAKVWNAYKNAKELDSSQVGYGKNDLNAYNLKFGRADQIAVDVNPNGKVFKNLISKCD